MKAAGANTVGALFVLLDLLERHPQTIRQLNLSEVEHKPTHADTAANMLIYRVMPLVSLMVARVYSTRAICAQQTVTAKPVFFGVVSTKNGPVGSPGWGHGRARNKCLPHIGESWNVAGRTREYRGGVWDRSGRSDRAGQKPAPTGRCRERRWQKSSSLALLLKESAARYEADNATGLVPLSPMQRSRKTANHRQAYRNLNHGVMRRHEGGVRLAAAITGWRFSAIPRRCGAAKSLACAAIWCSPAASSATSTG